MKVLNPKTDMSVSLIPWFMVIGRPYPFFVYAYAIGHYHKEGKKSLEETALAVRKLFGIDSFHKSTVSRSISAMGKFIDTARLDQPLSVNMLKAQDSHPGVQPGSAQDGKDIAEQVCEILKSFASYEELERGLDEKIKRFPEPLSCAKIISYAFGSMPEDHFKIIVHDEPGCKRRRDIRRRRPRARQKKTNRVQRCIKFVDYSIREAKRKEFIEICMCLVLDAAVKHHRFLL
jgi:hypothetical protein